MTLHIDDQHALKRASKAISKIPGSPSLSRCQTALARATGHRDLHHALAEGAKEDTHPAPQLQDMVDVVARLQFLTELPEGDLLDALLTSRFLTPGPDPELALKLRAALFAPRYRAKSLGSPVQIFRRGATKRGLLLNMGETPDATCEVLAEFGNYTCYRRELTSKGAASFFIPLQFWAPYGVWSEADGTQVIFSRDYFPLWRIAPGRAPERDDPNRWVPIVQQRIFAPLQDLRLSVADMERRSFEILREYRVASIPRLVEWLPVCIERKKAVSYLKVYKSGPYFSGKTRVDWPEEDWTS